MEISTMEFFNPSVVFKGAVRADNAPSNDSDLTRKQDIAGLSYISAIASGSSSMLSVSNGELSISSLALTDVHVDNTQTSLANFVANESSTAQGLGTGDVLILTAPSAGTETYIVSGANGGSVGNYTQIESPITAAEIGSVISAGDGISINSSTAQISANLAAGTGLSSSVSNGQITFALSANSDQISEGSSNLFFTNARSRSALSVESVSLPDANLLQYNSSTGAFKVLLSDILGEFTAGTGLSYSNGEYSLSATTSNISEGSNLYFTDARARAALSAGTGIAYNSSTGVISANLVAGTAIDITGNTISFDGSTSDVVEGSNLYYTDARVKSAVGADAAAGNLLSYNSSTGKFLVATSSVQGVFSAGTAISISAGEIAFSGSTSDVSEGSNLYYTDARVKSAVGADAAAGNLLSYNSTTGKFLVATSSVQGAFSAGTGIAISAGSISVNADTDDIPEGQTNEYFTPARARGAVAVSNASDELLSYNSSNGQFSLVLSDLRYEAQVTLSANTPYTITHNLGKKLVHVSAMDANGNQIQLNVVYSSTSALTVESVSGVTVDVAVSL
jgi:hypothetical protein